VQTGKAFPGLLIVLLGTLDCATTLIGIAYFGASEQNPVMSSVVGASLGAFTLVKIGTTLVVGLIFYQADSLLMKTPDKNSQSFIWTRKILKVSLVSVIAFFSVVVLNNIIVLMNSI
jgi:hypothetical protein